MNLNVFVGSEECWCDGLHWLENDARVRKINVFVAQKYILCVWSHFIDHSQITEQTKVGCLGLCCA